jgi:Tfp pilus assembly protein PilE
MNRKTATLLALSVSALVAMPAWADQIDAVSTKSRAEVQAELIQAERTGEMQDLDSGYTFKQEYPDRYPAATATASKTRAEVKAELIRAERSGEMPVGYAS